MELSRGSEDFRHRIPCREQAAGTADTQKHTRHLTAETRESAQGREVWWQNTQKKAQEKLFKSHFLTIPWFLSLACCYHSNTCCNLLRTPFLPIPNSLPGAGRHACRCRSQPRYWEGYSVVGASGCQWLLLLVDWQHNFCGLLLPLIVPKSTEYRVRMTTLGNCAYPVGR